MEMLSWACHATTLMRSQHCFRQWLGAVMQQANYLSQCWPWSEMLYNITKPQWVDRTVYLSHHIHIWQVSLQLSPGDTCQIWTWLKCSKRNFHKIRNGAQWQNLLTPTPRLLSVTSPFLSECRAQCFQNISLSQLLRIMPEVPALLQHSPQEPSYREHCLFDNPAAGAATPAAHWRHDVSRQNSAPWRHHACNHTGSQWCSANIHKTKHSLYSQKTHIIIILSYKQEHVSEV